MGEVELGGIVVDVTGKMYRKSAPRLTVTRCPHHKQSGLNAVFRKLEMRFPFKSAMGPSISGPLNCLPLYTPLYTAFEPS